MNLQRVKSVALDAFLSFQGGHASNPIRVQLGARRIQFGFMRVCVELNLRSRGFALTQFGFTRDCVNPMWVHAGLRERKFPDVCKGEGF